MYKVDDYVWAIINPIDTPKYVVITDVSETHTNTVGVKITYTVQYKNRKFDISNENVYPDQKTAEIFWSILILQDYEYTVKNPDLFATDDFEIASLKAKKLLEKYIETDPDLIFKYS